MRLMPVIVFMMLSGFIAASFCEAFGSNGNRAGADMLQGRYLRQFQAHGKFYPHPHMRNLKMAAKRGKVLVVTLVVSAGLLALVGTALIRTGKKRGRTAGTETISPAELRSWVIAAAGAGLRGLEKGREHALSTALSSYASARNVAWRDRAPKHSSTAASSIGMDRVTVTISNDGSVLDVRSVCGDLGASATANAVDGSVRSSVFTSHALEREADSES